jgi:hypothetical protein
MYVDNSCPRDQVYVDNKKRDQMYVDKSLERDQMYVDKSGWLTNPLKS